MTIEELTKGLIEGIKEELNCTGKEYWHVEDARKISEAWERAEAGHTSLMRHEAIDATLFVDSNYELQPVTPNLERLGYHAGDKVKLIILKDDESEGL